MMMSLTLTSRQTAFLLLIIIFTLGIITGFSAAKIYPHRRSSSTTHNRKPIDVLTQKTSLTSDQRKRVEEILREADKQYHQLRLQSRPKFDAINEMTGNRIRTILSPMQVAAYDRWIDGIETKPKQPFRRD